MLVAHYDRMANDIEDILQTFQRDLVERDSRLNLVWNTVNVVLRVLLTKRVSAGGAAQVTLLTESEVRDAGAALMKEAHENMDRAKQAAKENRMPRPGELTPTPLEELRRHINTRRTALGTVVKK